MTNTPTEGWHGWDDYAAFYDWENQRTLGRHDVRFWQSLAERERGPVLELGCGTGRVSLPVARTGARVVGVDRSEPMLARARRRIRRARWAPGIDLIRADIRLLPFRVEASFGLVMAPYGVLQSLVRERDLSATLDSVARVTAPRGLFGIDLVPDVPRWSEYRNRVTLHERTRRGSTITLTESVRQDRARHLTIFDQRFLERRPSVRPVVRHFALTFRTLSVQQVVRRVEKRGFEVEGVLGDYDGQPWDRRADVWLVLARKRA